MNSAVEGTNVVTAHRGRWLMAGISAAFLTGLIGLYVLRLDRPGMTNERPVAGMMVTIGVEPFEASDSVPPGWTSVAFAESLANRLSMVPWLQAHASRSGVASHYTLRGRVTMQDGRLILATRLGTDSERDTVWTATFWRNPESGNSILPDLASAVAEAITNETIRQTQTRGKK